VSFSRRLLIPLVLATMATQASIVVLSPIVVEIGRDLGASVAAIGQGRSLMAATAVVASLAVGSVIDRVGVRPLLVGGATLGLAGAIATGAAPSLALFFAAHVLVGLGVAGMLSGGFAGVATYFDGADSARAMGYVVGGQSIAWIAGTPIIGLLTDAVSWRLAYAVPAVACVGALAAALAVLPRAQRGSFATATATAIANGSGRGRGSTVTASGERGSGGLFAVARNPSARRWALAELVAYAAWTAELTYAGAFYVQTYGIEEAAVGLLLAAGSLAFLASSAIAAPLARRFARRRPIVIAALGMGATLVPLLNLTPAVWFTLALFCVMAIFAGVRTVSSSTLGLSQLPARPGSMMAARTASAQLGYMVGAVAGGAVLAVADFGTLGFVLFAGMAFAALLVLRVSDPEPRGAPSIASGAKRHVRSASATVPPATADDGSERAWTTKR